MYAECWEDIYSNRPSDVICSYHIISSVLWIVNFCECAESCQRTYYLYQLITNENLGRPSESLETSLFKKSSQTHKEWGNGWHSTLWKHIYHIPTYMEPLTNCLQRLEKISLAVFIFSSLAYPELLCICKLLCNPPRAMLGLIECRNSCHWCLLCSGLCCLFLPLYQRGTPIKLP